MFGVSVLMFLFSCINVGLLQGTGSGTNGKLRLCVVETRGMFKRSQRYCPLLDQENADVECVLGTDRLDCLRRISKGTVDFGVFSPEDLVAAQWAMLDVLVTNEIRHRDSKEYERSVVALVNRRILPDSSSTLHAVLRNSSLCHPGVGLSNLRPLSDTLSGYLESLVLERSCDPTLSLAENRVRALSRYFGKACRAGPWIADTQRDRELKEKYPSLCAACGDPSRCTTSDRYWGAGGALQCAAEGAGDVAWAEYDDVIQYFGLHKLDRDSSTYPPHVTLAYLCRDGTWRAVGAEPCIWLHRPWNVVVAKRKAAAAVAALTSKLTNSSAVVDTHWAGAVVQLLDSSSALRDALSPPLPAADYLAGAKGFREAYSQGGCDPPRYITVCTTSLLEKNKCEWLAEAAAVYGVSPPLQCSIESSKEECMRALTFGGADVVVGDTDWLVKGKPYAFEAVAVVLSQHTGGLAGLRGGLYCHPGLDVVDQRWSPRVLKALEVAAAQTDRCGSVDPNGKSADQIELETLNGFFSAACRPGAWSANATQDASLKTQYPSLCSLCGGNSCTGYSIDMGVSIAGARNDNRHIQTLECLRVNSNSTTPAVAYSAWQHVREYYTYRNPQDAASYSLLCPDGSLQPLTTATLNNSTAPCAFVRQPWGAIVASTNSAANVLANLRTWWPTGASPGGSSWQTVLFTALAGGANARVVFQDAPVSLANYTEPIRPITSIDSTTACIPSRRWCTLSTAEQSKCSWVRGAAHTLGIQPAISCNQRASVIDCLKEIKEDRADFISSPSNYGYLARQHYKLSPVKMVQNQHAAASRIAAFVKESATTNITRFENLRGAKACFPEYGGLAYVAFVRAGLERGILSSTECDYAKTVGEFFSATCAPGAEDASHALSASTYDPTNLCSVCKPANSANSTVNVANTTTPICTWDYSNMYFGNNGSLACLNDPETDVAFLNTRNITAYLSALNLQGTQFRALCRNNSLAVLPGVTIDDNCALAYVVDAEVVTRRGDQYYTSLNVLFDTLEQYFGYTAVIGTQLINLELFSPFDGTSDLLFKDSTIGLTEPTEDSTHEPAKNYIELFQHLDTCTAGAEGLASGVYSMVSLVILSVMARFIIN